MALTVKVLDSCAAFVPTKATDEELKHCRRTIEKWTGQKGKTVELVEVLYPPSAILFASGLGAIGDIYTAFEIRRDGKAILKIKLDVKQTRIVIKTYNFEEKKAAKSIAPLFINNKESLLGQSAENELFIVDGIMPIFADFTKDVWTRKITSHPFVLWQSGPCSGTFVKIVDAPKTVTAKKPTFNPVAAARGAGNFTAVACG
jgi:hypothetical protein